MAALSGSYKVAFSPDLAAFKGIGESIRKDLEKATKGLPENFDKMMADLESSMKDLSSRLDGDSPLGDNWRNEGEEAGRDFAAGLDDQATKGTSGIGGKIGGVLGGIGKAAMVGVGAAAAGIGTMAGAGLKATADLQQSLGGVEAVFGGNADAIKDWASKAAGSMGISMNSAMETATNMGSLFQGSGFEADKAAQMSMDMAQRAADVASVRGISLESAMEAVSGAAKGNFEMMDNLGVAMNNSSLNAFAVSKGIDKSVESMSTAEKTGLAYEMFMEQSAYAAGNFEKENESLAGSMDILKASWGDVLSSMADPEMLERTIETFIGSLKTVVSSVSEILPQIMQGIVTIIQELLPVLLETIVDIIPVIAEMLMTSLPVLITTIMDALPGLLETLMAAIVLLLPLVLELIVQIILGLVEMLPSLITQFVEALVTLLPMILDAAITLFMGLVDALPTVIEALVGALPLIIEGAIKLFMGIIEAIPVIIVALVQALPDIVIAIVNALIEAIPMLIDGAFQLFMGIMEALPMVIIEIVKALPEIIETLVFGFIDAGAAIIDGMWQGLQDAFPQLMENVMNLLSELWEGFLDFFDINSPSKLMADTVGLQIGAGVGAGIEDSITGALKSADKFSTELYSEFGDGAHLDAISSDMPIESTGSSGRTLNQYITVPKPESLTDISRAAKRGGLAGFPKEK